MTIEDKEWSICNLAETNCLLIFWEIFDFWEVLLINNFFSFKVETELIDKLDILVSENKGDDEYRQLFNTM